MEEPIRHVLYCEDHDDTSIMMTMMLVGAGFRVTTAGCGKECLRLAGSGEPF